jgi:hypothetical protein
MSNALIRVYTDKEIAFWRKLTLPQEDKDPDRRWQGIGYRWFRDQKVACLEHYRRPRAQPTTCEAA